jgi:hypothetical protein
LKDCPPSFCKIKKQLTTLGFEDVPDYGSYALWMTQDMQACPGNVNAEFEWQKPQKHKHEHHHRKKREEVGSHMLTVLPLFYTHFHSFPVEGRRHGDGAISGQRIFVTTGQQQGRG